MIIYISLVIIFNMCIVFWVSVKTAKLFFVEYFWRFKRWFKTNFKNYYIELSDKVIIFGEETHMIQKSKTKIIG